MGSSWELCICENAWDQNLVLPNQFESVRTYGGVQESWGFSSVMLEIDLSVLRFFLSHK